MNLVTTTLTLAEYLSYGDGTERCYELEYGQLQLTPVESELNQRITIFLVIYFSYFSQQKISAVRLKTKLKLVVSGASASVRVPSLMLISPELATNLVGVNRSMISLEMPPPQLVLEVVSPGQENRDRAYRYKRSEYAARGIEEYWIVDPIQSVVTIFQLVNGDYELVEFRGEDYLRSNLFSGLRLTAQQVLAAGESRF